MSVCLVCLCVCWSHLALNTLDTTLYAGAWQLATPQSAGRGSAPTQRRHNLLRHVYCGECRQRTRRRYDHPPASWALLMRYDAVDFARLRRWRAAGFVYGTDMTENQRWDGAMKKNQPIAVKKSGDERQRQRRFIIIIVIASCCSRTIGCQGDKATSLDWYDD